MRAVLSGGTADAFVIEGDIDIADTATASVSFKVWFDPDFTATADDTVALFELQGTTNIATGSIGFRYVEATDVINFGIGGDDEQVAPTAFGAEAIQRGVWYTVEGKFNIETNASGTFDLYVSRSDHRGDTAAVASGTSIDGIAVLRGVLGIQDHLATTLGTILFDDFKFDDLQLFHDARRFPDDKLLTKTGHILTGPGSFDGIELLSGAGTNNVLTVFDTSVANTDDEGNIAVEIKNLTNNELVPSRGPVTVSRGAYVVMSGTNPRAIARGIRGSTYGSVANARSQSIGT
jgi:hypothetical protein